LSSRSLKGSPSGLSAVRFSGFDYGNMLIDSLNAVAIAAAQEHFPITCPFQLLQWELAKAGTAIAIFPEDIGDAEPRLQKVYETSGPLLSIPMWLVCHGELRTSRRVRRVFDLLAKELGAPSVAPL